MKKTLITIILTLASILALAITTQAYSVGELNDDGIVNASDALIILKHSAKVSLLSNDISKFADVDWDGSINATDALYVLKQSAKIESMPDNNPYFYEFQEFNGMMVNKLPYTSNGITINSLSVDEYGYMTVSATNNTTKTVAYGSWFNFRCLNVNGEIVKEGSFTLRHLDPGETGFSGFYLTDNTYKIIFTYPKTYEGISSQGVATETNNGIVTNVLPYSLSGLTINSISVDKYGYATVNVTNNVGSAIKSTTCIDYKCYDASGQVLKSSSVYMKEINNGQNCDVGFYLADNTAKLVFYAADVDADTSTGNIATEVINGVAVNKLPYTDANKLTISNIRVETDYVYLTVTNNTGSTISNSSYISYKSSDSNGTVLRTSSVNLPSMNNGEKCIIKVSKSADVASMVFYSSYIRTRDAIPAYKTSNFSGVSANVLPATFSGVSITSFAVENGSYAKTVTIGLTNSSGNVVGDSSYLYYRCFNSSGVVISDSIVNLYAMNNGEKCLRSFSIPTDAATVIFYDINIQSDVASASVTTSNYGGVAMNACPYSSNGIKMNSISVDNNKVTVSVVNEAGSAIKSSSYISYKCYNKDGVVVYSGDMYLNNMNNGDSYNAVMYKTADTTKIIFYNFKVTK